MINVGSKSSPNNHDLDLGLSDKSESKGQADLFGNIFMAISLKEEDLGSKNAKPLNNLSIHPNTLETENLDLFLPLNTKNKEKQAHHNNNSEEIFTSLKNDYLNNDTELNKQILNKNDLFSKTLNNQNTKDVNDITKEHKIKEHKIEEHKIEENNKFINNIVNDKNKLLNESLKTRPKIIPTVKDNVSKTEEHQKKQTLNQNIDHKDLELNSLKSLNNREINSLKPINNKEIKVIEINNDLEQIKNENKNYNENSKVIIQDDLKIQFRQRNDNGDFVNINNNIKLSGSSSESFLQNNSNNGFSNSSNLSSQAKINEINEMLDLADERWTENLVNKLNKAKSDKLAEIELSLSPKKLGKMKLLINIQDEKASVTIKTENVAASLIVNEQESKLNHMFEQYGMRLASFNSESFNSNQGKNSNQNNNEKNSLNKEDSIEDKNNEKDNINNEETLLNIRV